MSFEVRNSVRVIGDDYLCKPCDANVHTCISSANDICTHCVGHCNIVVYDLHQRLHKGRATQFKYCVDCVVKHVSSDKDKSGAIVRIIAHITAKLKPATPPVEPVPTLDLSMYAMPSAAAAILKSSDGEHPSAWWKSHARRAEEDEIEEQGTQHGLEFDE